MAVVSRDRRVDVDQLPSRSSSSGEIVREPGRGLSPHLSNAKVKIKVGTAKINTLRINLLGMAKECDKKNAMIPAIKKIEYKKIISASPLRLDNTRSKPSRLQ